MFDRTAGVLLTTEPRVFWTKFPSSLIPLAAISQNSF